MAEPKTASDFLHPRHWPTWLGYGLLRIFALLPYRPMMALGRGIGRLSMRLPVKRRRITDINLALCFPERDQGARDALAGEHGAALGMGMMDFAIAWWWSDSRLYPWVDIEGREHVERAMAAGNGVIFLTAHFTSIEISGRLLSGLCTALPMYRPNNNPLLEVLMVRNRERHVERVIPRQDVRLMLRTLRQGKGVWFAPDQNFGAKGSVFAPFFGIPASTNTSLRRFVEMTGAAVVPFVVLRRPDGRYRMIIEPPLEGYPSDDPVDDAARYNQLVEAWVREAPEQYSWVHRRFKKRPEGEAKIY
jgi:KDO2-lipid IV(A) lauroyltransferase